MISGVDAQNYIFTQPQGITADIIPRAVTILVTSPPSTSILIPFGTTAVRYSGNDYKQNVTIGFSITGHITDETVMIIVCENNFGLSGGNESGASGTLTVNYDGSQVNQTSAVRVELNITGNYQLNAATSNSEFNVQIKDGLADDRWLPVLNDNITEFNNYALTAGGLNRHYRLVEDITLAKPQAGVNNWTAIGTFAAGFSGTFNGNGYVIKNLNINRPFNNQGLFGVIAVGGMIQNTALVNVNITGSNYVGGLAGMNNGTINTSYVTGAVSGLNSIGGLVGINNGMIDNCYAASSVTGQQSVGGATGVIDSGGTVKYCYTMGKIYGGSYIGGITGYISDNASLINCMALNNRVTKEAANYGDIGRVAGAASNQSVLTNNYVRPTMLISKTNLETGRNKLDGETVTSGIYREASWWTDSGNWVGGAWNFTSMWQVNGRYLPKLINAGGSQNHELVFSIEEVWIPAGSFKMGSPADELYRNEDEGPQHTVNLSGFYIGKYEVTTLQYTSIFYSASYSITPWISTSWYNALVYCNKQSMLEDLSPAYRINNSTDPEDWGAVPTSANAMWDAVEIVSGSTGYRLPTEAQWEYACRAGTTTAYVSGEYLDDKMSWYYDNSYQIGVKSVGLTLPNAWGLYDMYGNASEWCWDLYGAYTGNEQTDPLGALSGSARVHRGGDAYRQADTMRSAARFQREAHRGEGFSGFRLVRP